MGDVVDLNPGPKPHVCPTCGGSWWLTDGITVDETGSATGYAMPLRCVVCTTGGDLRVLTQADNVPSPDAPTLAGMADVPHHTNAGYAMPSRFWQTVRNQAWPEQDQRGGHARSILAEATERTPVQVRLLFAEDGWDVLDGEVRRRVNGCVYVHVDDRRVVNGAVWVSEADVRPPTG